MELPLLGQSGRKAVVHFHAAARRRSLFGRCPPEIKKRIIASDEPRILGKEGMFVMVSWIYLCASAPLREIFLSQKIHPQRREAAKRDHYIFNEDLQENPYESIVAENYETPENSKLFRWSGM